MNQRKFGTLLSYLHIILNNTISIIYTPYMLRMMGQSEYGLFGTANSFISYLSILSFGVGGAYIRFNARCRATGDKDEEARLNGMFLSVFSFLSVLVLVGGTLCIVFVDKLVGNTFTVNEIYKLRVILFVLTLNTMATFIFNVVMMALMAYEKFIAIRLTTLIAGVVTPLCNVIALKIGGRAITITVLSTVIGISCMLFYLFYAKRVIAMRFSFRGFQFSLLTEIFTFSGFLFLNSITDQITFSTDNIILGATLGTSAVAVYTVGSNFKNYFQQFSSAISGVFAPKINMLVAQKQGISALDDVFIRVGRIQFYMIALIIIGYISIGQDFVRLWAGNDYGDAFYIGLLLMLSVCIPSFQNVGLEIQKAMNMHKARSIVYFFIALTNVLLTIPFSRMWGGIGAALATALCMILGYSIFMNWHYSSRLGLNIKKFWLSIAQILPGCVPPIIVGWFIHQFWSLNSFLSILAAALIISTVFLCSVWKFSMNSYEHDLFSAPIRKVRSILKSRLHM